MFNNEFYHESPNLSRNSAIIILLLSLLLNMGLLVLICSIVTPYRDIEIMKEHLQDSWPFSANPAQVIIHNPQPLVSLPASQNVATTASAQTTPGTWTSLSGNIQNQSVALPADNSTEESRNDTDAEEYAGSIKEEANDYISDNESTSDSSTIPDNKTNEDQEASSQSDSARPDAKSSTYMPKSNRIREQRIKNRSAISPRQRSMQRDQFTLNQLVNGFLGQPTAQEKKPTSAGFGNRAIMEGTGYGVPTKEQLVYERYIQRIVHCMRNAYAYSKFDMPSLPNSPNPVSVGFSLDEQGKLVSLIIVQSSNNRALDNFVLHVFREASMSFPPVPASIYKNPFTMQCIDALMIMHHHDAQLIIK